MSIKLRPALLLAVLGLVLLGGLFFFNRPSPDPVVVPGDPDTGALPTEDTAGPYLKITVAGEANGVIEVDLMESIAPNHVAQITALANDGFYNGVHFHRVIEGFMAQTGDGEFATDAGDPQRAGMGGSPLPDIKAEFSDVPFDRGIVGMARSQSVNSANSQFFIMFDAGHFLNGQYTVVGRVTNGLDVLDKIKRGHAQSGAIDGTPDKMVTVEVTQ